MKNVELSIQNLKLRLCILVQITTLLVSGCSPSSGIDYQQEGQAIVRTLASALKKIKTKEELLQNKEEIKKHFNNLVNLMIEARETQRSSSIEFTTSLEKNFPATTLLKSECIRLYAIEGVRETMEKIQSEPLRRLDAYERKRKSNAKIL